MNIADGCIGAEQIGSQSRECYAKTGQQGMVHDDTTLCMFGKEAFGLLSKGWLASATIGGGDACQKGHARYPRT
eukprot:355400-Chlamydomonas_euryale.AAC.4